MSDHKNISISDPRLTNSQRSAIIRLRERRAPRDGYEFKRNELSFWQSEQNTKLSRLYLIIETGLKNDDGTLAAIFGRDRYHFCIGKRGGIESHDGNKFQRNYLRDCDYTSRNERIAQRERESI